MKAPSILAPLRYSDFRLLWAGMGASYAGDRLQEMSQAWLVASLTSSSALAVATIGITAAIPQMVMPVGGPRVSLTIRRTALAQQRLGRSERRRSCADSSNANKEQSSVISTTEPTHTLCSLERLLRKTKELTYNRIKSQTFGVLYGPPIGRCTIRLYASWATLTLLETKHGCEELLNRRRFLRR
jgi:Transmembrane secretion effector